MRILVLEDEENLNGLIRGYLVSNGMMCKQALNLSEARTQLTSDSFDLLLCDLNLPDGSGLDLVDYVRKNLPDMGIVIISAKDQLKDRLKGLELGADD
jgi:two-component system OmpR family response regulator